MIKEELLKGVSPEIQKALSVLNHSVGSMIGIQILIADPSEELLDAYAKQGSKLSEVNEARERAGLHKISLNTNKTLISESWVDPIRSAKAAVFVFLNGHNRMKSNQTIETAVQYVSDLLPEVGFDLVQGVRSDVFLCYVKEEIDQAEDPSEEILDLQGSETEKKKKSTRKTKKDESI